MLLLFTLVGSVNNAACWLISILVEILDVYSLKDSMTTNVEEVLIT